MYNFVNLSIKYTAEEIKCEAPVEAVLARQRGRQGNQKPRVRRPSHVAPTMDQTPLDGLP